MAERAGAGPMIPAFDPPPLRVEEIDRDRWRLVRELGYTSAIVGRVVVPDGFVTDFESVPRVLPIAYALVYGYARRAAVVHDWYYQGHQVTRSTADAVFDEAMGALEVEAWRRWAIWSQVRLWGWRAWNRNVRRFVALGNAGIMETLA